MLGRILTHLEFLVGCDTQNPPRLISKEHPVITYCADVLRGCGCSISIEDLGDGCVSLHATRGISRTLVNCHLDTVPADSSWSRDPFVLVIEADRAIGLGACDIKGAVACILTAAQESDGPLALLLTTDEEAGQSCCVRSFLRDSSFYERALVAEPTGGMAVRAHRGLATFELEFSGCAAHSSLIGVGMQSAVHQAARWCADALELAHDAPYNNIRLNIGVIEGGTKANVSASSARVVFGMRPPPGMDPEGPANALKSLIKDTDVCTWIQRFTAPSLDESSGSAGLLRDYGLEPADPVDFWTEAALFHEAGIATVVLGPGDISQAHAADEYVLLCDLESVYQSYKRVFSGTPESKICNAVVSEAQGANQL